MNIERNYPPEEMVKILLDFRGIHIECSPVLSDKLLRCMIANMDNREVGYVTQLDKGYERETVKSYLRFFHDLTGCRQDFHQILRSFGLTDIQRKKIRFLNPGEHTLVQIARVSMQKANIYFLEDPLLNLKDEGRKAVLNWIEERYEQNACFFTTHGSLRNALLLPGTAFYSNRDQFQEVEQEGTSDVPENVGFTILKIPAKSGSSTLLFEPKDIDYIESLNKNNYLSVRGTAFQVAQTMDELEDSLRTSGFFRCHRSYLVNMQRVKRFEQVTRNSYALLLDDAEETQIPLAKGRIQQMRELFHW